LYFTTIGEKIMPLHKKIDENRKTSFGNNQNIRFYQTQTYPKLKDKDGIKFSFCNNVI